MDTLIYLVSALPFNHTLQELFVVDKNKWEELDKRLCGPLEENYSLTNISRINVGFFLFSLFLPFPPKNESILDKCQLAVETV